MRRIRFLLFPMMLIFVVFDISLAQSIKAPIVKQPVLNQALKLQNVQNIQQSVLSMRDETISAVTMAQIADLTWKFDEEYARGMFSFSIGKVAAGQNDSAKELSSKTEARRKVISLIAGHDSAWAKRMVEELTKDSTRKAWAQVQIAGDLLESDPKSAADFAEQSMQTQITENLVSFLRKLRQTNPDEADRLFLQILARYSQQPIVDANQFALLGVYLFRSARMEPSDPGLIMVLVGTIIMPDISANRPDIPAGIIRSYISGAISLMNRPTNDSDQRTVKYALGRLLVPKAQEFAPNLVGDLLGAMASLAPVVPPVFSTDTAYKYVGMKESAPEDRIKEIEKTADSFARDQLFLDMVFHAYRRQDFDTAKLAASKVAEKGLKDELETLIQFGEANEFLKSKTADLTDATQLIEKLPESLEKCMLRLAVATVAHKAKNKTVEEDMLGSARDSAKRLNDETAPFLLLYIAGQMKTNADIQSAVVLAEAAKVFNKYEKIEDPALEHKVGVQPLVYRFSLAVKDVNLDFQSSFPNAVKGDEENTIMMVNDIKDERLKGLAYVSLVKSILAKKATAAPSSEPKEPTKTSEEIRPATEVKTSIPANPIIPVTPRVIVPVPKSVRLRARGVKRPIKKISKSVKLVRKSKPSIRLN